MYNATITPNTLTVYNEIIPTLACIIVNRFYTLLQSINLQRYSVKILYRGNIQPRFIFALLASFIIEQIRSSLCILCVENNAM